MKYLRFGLVALVAIPPSSQACAMMAAKIFINYIFFAIQSTIYVPGNRMRSFPKVFQISCGNVVLDVVSGKIGVNGWIDSRRNRLFNLNGFRFFPVCVIHIVTPL